MNSNCVTYIDPATSFQSTHVGVGTGHVTTVITGSGSYEPGTDLNKNQKRTYGKRNFDQMNGNITNLNNRIGPGSVDRGPNDGHGPIVDRNLDRSNSTDFVDFVSIGLSPESSHSSSHSEIVQVQQADHVTMKRFKLAEANQGKTILKKICGKMLRFHPIHSQMTYFLL